MTPFLLQGLVLGSTYALLAFGFGLVYSTTRVFHFAYGAVYALAGYVTWWSAARLGFAPAMALGLGAAMLLGLAVEVLLYRPLRRRRATVEVLFLTSLGVFMVGGNALAWAFGHETLPLSLDNPVYTLHEATNPADSLRLTRVQVVTMAAAAVCFVAVWLLLAKTRFGVQLRAYAAGRELAVALGIDESELLARTALLSALVGGIAAVCVAADVGVSPEMGLDAVVIGAVAVVVGGVGSLTGTAVGGLLLGLLRKLTAYRFGAEWEEAVTFALLLLILLARPRGLLGRRG